MAFKLHDSHHGLLSLVRSRPKACPELQRYTYRASLYPTLRKVSMGHKDKNRFPEKNKSRARTNNAQPTKWAQSQSSKPKVVSQAHIGPSKSTPHVKPSQAQRFLWPFMKDDRSGDVKEIIKKHYGPEVPEQYKYKIQCIMNAAPYLPYMRRLHIEIGKHSTFPWRSKGSGRSLSTEELQERDRETQTSILFQRARWANWNLPTKVLTDTQDNDIRTWVLMYDQKYAAYRRRVKVINFFKRTGLKRFCELLDLLL